MPKGKGSVCDVIKLAGVCLALGCAGTSWPDEPGIPVALVQADNVQAGDSFLAVLTARRRAANLPAPIVAPRYQTEIRAFAEDLQAGKTSVTGAERAIAEWAHRAYMRDVVTFAIDCGAGERMELPSRLVEMPTAAISYAAAHFRPRSQAKDQCALLVVALVGAASL